MMTDLNIAIGAGWKQVKWDGILGVEILTEHRTRFLTIFTST